MPRTKGAKDSKPRKRRSIVELNHELPVPEVIQPKRAAKPWHLTAIRMYASGKTIRAIAVDMHKTEDAVSAAIKRYPEHVEQAVRELAQPEKMFMPMLPKAAAVYHQILDKNSDEVDAATLRVQQGVAGDIFDRAYGRPVQRNINEGHHEVVIKFEDASDSDSAKKNEELVLAQLNAGS